MLRLLKNKAFKLICLITRKLTRRLYLQIQCGRKLTFKYSLAIKLFSWSDYHICYTLRHTFIWPGVLLRLAASCLTYVASKNVVSVNPVCVRSQAIGRLADKLIHKIPDKFRYPTVSNIAT